MMQSYILFFAPLSQFPVRERTSEYTLENLITPELYRQILHSLILESTMKGEARNNRPCFLPWQVGAIMRRSHP